MTLTTAQIIRADLCRNGQSVETLTTAELAPYYQQIHYVKDGADLAGAAEIMPRCSHSVVNEPIVGVIVETRAHRNLPFVVDQALQLGIRVQLYHGSGNTDFIHRSLLAPSIEAGLVTLTELRTDRMTATLYNGLFLSVPFWETMIGRHKILVFQTDALFCPRSSYRPEHFAEYDYIGPAWRRRHSSGIVSFGGIGGFTLRDWPRSTDALHRFDPTAWPAGEDRYFPFHMELIGARVAVPEECDRFCTQFRFSERSLGAHKLNGLGWGQLLRFLAYCPQAWRIIQPFVRWRAS